jgi:hypothetical protein
MKIITCPDCAKEAKVSGSVNCLCDKDHCLGQRCGADDLSAKYDCNNCGVSGVPAETAAYRKRHCS